MDLVLQSHALSGRTVLQCQPHTDQGIAVERVAAVRDAEAGVGAVHIDGDLGPGRGTTGRRCSRIAGRAKQAACAAHI